ncbi:MAG TPA: ATP-binding protein [Sphingomonas sp.]|nr:ATP-binding protein [Sphingomonas sp.]
MPQPETVAAGGPGPAELLAALPVGILVLDPDRRIARVNAACEQLLNLSERVLLGQRLDDILALPGAARSRHDGHALAAFDVEIETSRGARVRVDYLETLLSDRAGWRVITLHHAATPRVMGVSPGRDAGARAAVGAAAMLAHEIKNPLSGIRGAAQLLADRDGAADLTSLIVTEVDRIAALIDGMQDFSDTTPLELTPENIYPLLDHARRLAAAGFAREVAIEERFDPSLPAVLVNRDALLQVILNLLKNASEAVAGQREPRIVLTTAYRQGVAIDAGPGKPRRPLPIELAVIDNGPGAPPDIAEHLFDPFVSGRPEGKGLGLALVDKLVRGMGGIVQYAREGAPEATVLRLRLARGDAA